MLRNILAVIAGYIVMALVVMVGLTGAYFALGADRAFEAGTYDVTILWIVVWAVASIVAALVGGVLCAKISKHSKGAVISLAILIGILGAGNVVFRMTAEAPSPEDQVRASDTPNFEAMTKAQAPIWMYITESLIGVVGVVAGAAIVCPGCKKDDAGTGVDA